MYNINHLKDPHLKKILKIKSDLFYRIVQYFNQKNFIQVSTPLLSFPTKEYGDEEFVVFSKLHPAKYYTLPHSPQLYKQYLMATFGEDFKGYFQFARNFRPEIRDNTHEQEFEQIDFEIYKANLNQIIKMISDIVAIGFFSIGVKPQYKFIKYDEVISKFGVDNPDLRYLGGKFEYRENIVSFLIPLKDIEIERIKEVVIPKEIQYKVNKSNCEFFCPQGKSDVLGKLRNEFIDKKIIINKEEWSFVFITDLPIFVQKGAKFITHHHPQAAPWENSPEKLLGMKEEELLKQRAQSCDLIINGLEVAGGNVRISNYNMQKTILDIIGCSESKSKINFKPILSLFHFFPRYKSGGAAIGFDRLSMLISGVESLQKIGAFPMTKTDKEFFGGPLPVQDEDFLEFGLAEEVPLLTKSRIAAIAITEKNNNFIHGKGHILNIEKNILILTKQQNVNREELIALRLAAHWHDIGRNDHRVESKDHARESVNKFDQWAKRNFLEKELIHKVQNIIMNHRNRTKSGKKLNKLSALFWDADKLDILNVKRCSEILSYYLSIPERGSYNEFNLLESLSFWNSIGKKFINKFYTESARRLAMKQFPYFKKYIHKQFERYISKGSKIICLGGAEQVSGVFKEIDKFVCTNLHRKSFLYIPIAVFGQKSLLSNLGSYIKKVKNYYKMIDKSISFESILPNDSESDIIKKIKRASVIYLSGGSTPYLINFFKKTKVFGEIVRSYNNGKYIIANSAGVLALQEKAIFLLQEK